MKNRILLSVENFHPSLGGGEVFMDELMKELSKKNTCKIIYAGLPKSKSNLDLQPINISKVFKHIPIFNRTIIRQYFANKIWERILEREVISFKPNLLLTQLEYVPSTMNIAKKFNIKTIVFIQNYDHFCPFIFKGRDPFTCSKNCFKCSPVIYKIQFPFVTWLLEWHKQALKKADYIFSDSLYVKKVLQHFYGINSFFLPPILHLDKFEIKGKLNQKYITFINPIKTKGAEIAFKIMEKMQNTDFLVVGGKDEKMIKRFKSLKNVQYISWCDDMKDIYIKTKLLLVPSLWPEPFGRIITEAQFNGVPCIANCSGGLPEAVGDGGIIIKDTFNIDAWITEIKKFDKPEFYGKISKKAKRHTQKFTFGNQIKRFNKALIKLKLQ